LPVVVVVVVIVMVVVVAKKGMDPVVRRKIWSAIQKLKVGRLMVLTTHSMEEADVLGDKIAILHEGRMKALGTSMELKARFGKGYEVYTEAGRTTTSCLFFF
jgi:ABC-type multidrug transport system ATPase subunit